MRTSRSQLARSVADETLQADFDQQKIAASLAAYLLEERRTSDLSSLLRDIQHVWAEAGIVEVIAYTAHELSDAARTEIEAEARRVYPRAQRIIITSKHDNSVIGGVRLEFADYRLDLSVAGELRKFKTLAVQGKDYR